MNCIKDIVFPTPLFSHDTIYSRGKTDVGLSVILEVG
jgi:hypothetical protein